MVLVFAGFCCVSGEAFALKGIGEEAGPSAFHERLQFAFAEGLVGNQKLALAGFDVLSKEHPGEMIVADFHAQTLERHGKYRKAAQVLMRWLQYDGAKSEVHVAQAKEWIGRLKTKDDFTARLIAGEMKEDFVTIGSQEFIIHSNIPEIYQRKVLDLLVLTIQEEKRILTERFGITLEKVPALKVFLVGSREDYEKLKERFGWNIHGFLWQAFYIPKKQSIVIFFDGNINEALIAHGLAHHLVRSYIPAVSTMLNTGMAEYLAFEAAKKFSRKEITSRLEFINYLYDIGVWESAFDIFPVWKHFEQMLGEAVLKDPGTFLAFYDLYNLFYNGAWLLIHYFAETQDEAHKQLFLEYLEYERSNSENNVKTARKFFNRKFPTKEAKEGFDTAWGRHTVTLTYESI